MWYLKVSSSWRSRWVLRRRQALAAREPSHVAASSLRATQLASSDLEGTKVQCQAEANGMEMNTYESPCNASPTHFSVTIWKSDDMSTLRVRAVVNADSNAPICEKSATAASGSKLKSGVGDEAVVSVEEAKGDSTGTYWFSRVRESQLRAAIEITQECTPA